MLTLLLAVLICGIVAWVIYALPIPEPFKTIAMAILLIILVIIFFNQVLGVGTPLNIR